MNSLPSDSSPTAALDAQHVRTLLGPLVSRFNVECVTQCDSTNTQLLEHSTPSAMRQVLAAEHQLAGRGRRGRHWHAWPGQSLTFSVRWPFQQPPRFPAGLSLAVGVAVARTLEHLGVIGVQLKWPNDILVLGEKLGGILIELHTPRGQSPAAIIGIGLNIALPPEAHIEAAYPVTDLSQHVTTQLDRNALLAALLGELDQVLNAYEQHGFSAVRAEWLQRHAFADLPVRILDGGACLLEGECRGVDEDGVLLIATPNGLERVISGDVSLRSGETP